MKPFINPKRPLPKKYTERISIDFKFFFFDMDRWKLFFLYCEARNTSWMNLARELLMREIIAENKKFQLLLKAKRESEYVPFDDFNLNITPTRHFNKDFKAEKITMLGQFQKLHSKTRRPVNANLVWLERGVHGITDDKIFEDVLAQLIEEGQIDEVENDYGIVKYYTYIPIVPLRSFSKRFNKKNDNPFYERDLERMDKAKQNLKEGTTVRIKRKVGNKDE